MSTFNKKSTKTQNMNTNITLNHEGEIVYSLNALKSLLQRVVGSNFGTNTFYKTVDPRVEFKELVNLIESIPDEDKEYALKIAEIGRYSGMIEYPLNTLVACYNLDAFKGANFLDQNGLSKFGYYSDVLVRRTKDVNDILATQFALYGKKMPKQMRKNLKEKLEFFDEYKLSKGLDRGKSVSLADSIKLLHPTPKNEEMAAFYRSVIENKVVVGNNKAQLQAEIQNVKLQEKNQEKKEIDLDKLVEAMYQSNLSALLKNINILLQYNILDDEKHLNYVCNQITNKEVIKAAKILPAQFYALYKVLKEKPRKNTVVKLIDALSDAIEISIMNVDDIKGYSAFLIDVSGSMDSAVGRNSSISCMEMACLLGAIAFKKGNGDLFAFSDSCKRVDANRKDSIFTIINAIQGSIPHCCTYLDEAFRTISNFSKKHNIKYDNVLILSDGDCYTVNQNKHTLDIGDWGKSLNSKCDELMKDGVFDTIWINDLTRNNYTVVNTDECKKNLIAGYSEKFIDMMNLYYNIRNNDDIRPLIDALLQQYRG